MLYGNVLGLTPNVYVGDYEGPNYNLTNPLKYSADLIRIFLEL